MNTIRSTRSVCPICLKNIRARLEEENGIISLVKNCPEHGDFSVPIWRGLEDFAAWRGESPELRGEYGSRCPQNCGICPEHSSGSCCVLLEVTRRCNLNCRFCFAHEDRTEPTMAELKAAVDGILEHGRPLIQLSGGEPSLRDDLPELVGYIKSRGVSYVQLNTNGLRLARDSDYVRALAEAGLDIVFLQFDGVSEDIYEALRGRALLELKKRAIAICGSFGLGVTLVPTLVRGVNEHQVGDIIRFGAALSPVVRGVHFQPVSFFGHYPSVPDEGQRYTLDELIHALSHQAGIAGEYIAPSRCDHPGCGLHGSFVVRKDGSLTPLTRRGIRGCRISTAAQNRDYIGSRWSGAAAGEPGDDLEDMDTFISRVKSHSFTVTAMAFQDAMNIDIERLRRCSLHVWEDGRLKPFCAAYLTPVEMK